MYEELVKELRDSAEWADRLAVLMGRAEGDAHAPVMRKAADAIEELSKPRWIPVTERLPGIDDGDWVLGVVNGLAYGIVYKNAIVTVEYYENSGCWSLHDLDAKVAVTHWMPLPEPPEEVTQDD